MNENDLNRHLVGYTARVEPAPDPDGLRNGLARVDRNRRIRTLGATGSAIALVVFGFISLSGGQPAADLDVRGQDPAPVPADPQLAPESVESSPADSAAETAADVDTAPDPESATSPPEHLQATSTTTLAPVEVPTTTAPPPTTTAPATSVPPTTTAPPPTTTAPATFSASSRYGSCEEDPPYDEYSGTATPGTTVTVSSPYSAPAQTVADGAGHWYLRVEFSTAPVGSPFTVSASDGSSTVDMSFVRTG